MKKKALKKMLAVAASAAMVLSLGACGSDDSGSKNESEGEAQGQMDVTIDQIKLGEDYTDVKADLKFLTHKTDIIDSVFADYITEFQKLYPNVNIEYEGITDYANDVPLRLTTGDWGDICMVPTSVDKDELENFFTDFGTKDQLSKIYDERLLNNYAYADHVYGVPSMANV